MSLSNLRLEDMLARVSKVREKMDDFLKENKADHLRLNKKFNSHATAIKYFEKQFGYLSPSLNQCNQCTLQRNTIQNPKNDNHCFAITTSSIKITINPSIPLIIDDVVELMTIDDEKVDDSKK